ncbi:hypothetical protein T484DRAFT_1649820, partial [Baffinella frigidus]
NPRPEKGNPKPETRSQVCSQEPGSAGGWGGLTVVESSRVWSASMSAWPPELCWV